MKKAVIYARYSSDTQTEQSIEGQLRVCQNYAKTNNLLIVDTYIDRAMTGTNDMRPDFQRMIKASNKRQWEYVIVDQYTIKDYYFQYKSELKLTFTRQSINVLERA